MCYLFDALLGLDYRRPPDSLREAHDTDSRTNIPIKMRNLFTNVIDKGTYFT